MNFVKMHGLGNDFALVDATAKHLPFDSGRVRELADRRTGIGFDQLLLLEPAGNDEFVCAYRVFNADGSEAEQCGNGMRCIGLYLQRMGRVGDEPFRITGKAGPVTIVAKAPDRVSVDMGEPGFEPSRVPISAEVELSGYPLSLAGETVTVSALSLGNPHAVLMVEDTAKADVARLGPAIERHECFPARANVGFMQIVDRGHIRLRVHERGAGETRACGSGACAAVAAGRRLGQLDDRVEVALPGGVLVIEWKGEGTPVWMTGPAAWVYEGKIAT